MTNSGQKSREPPMSQTGLSRAEFCAIGEAIGNRVKTETNSPQIEYRVEPYYSDTTGEICLYYVDADEPTITIESIPSLGAERGITLSGPAADWTITNDVDDHNIITTLSVEQEPTHAAELFFRGPPAKVTPEGIEVEGDSPYPPLFND